MMLSLCSILRETRAKTKRHDEREKRRLNTFQNITPFTATFAKVHANSLIFVIKARFCPKNLQDTPVTSAQFCSGM